MSTMIDRPFLDRFGFKLGIIDLDNTLCDTESLRSGGVSIKDLRLFPYAKSLLERLPCHKVLLTSGDRALQEKKIRALNIGHYFWDVFICPKPEDKEDIIINLIELFAVQNTRDIFILGDRLDVEIKFGNKLNCTTVRMLYGKYASQVPDGKRFFKPLYTVNDLAVIFN